MDVIPPTRMPRFTDPFAQLPTAAEFAREFSATMALMPTAEDVAERFAANARAVFGDNPDA